MPFSNFSKSLKLCTVFSSASASLLLLVSGAAPPPTACRHIGEAAFPFFLGNWFPCLNWSRFWGSYGSDWERGRTRSSSSASSSSSSSSRDSCFQSGSGCFVVQGP